MRADKEQFAKMCELYRDWNSKINVISRKDIDNIYEHHILHSLAILRYWELTLTMQTESRKPQETGSAAENNWLAGKTVLDVGTGGGFPGIPLATMLPCAEFTLCDSVGKKIHVAKAVAEGLGLHNVHCVNARAESLDGNFDYAVSRAVAPLDILYSWTKDKFTSSLICLKGGDVNEEISTLCRKHWLSPSKVSTWAISEWLKDDYYEEKFVIEVRK